MREPKISFVSELKGSNYKRSLPFIMFIIIIYMMHDKCRRGFLVMFPLFVSFITILMAPQIQEQPRYAFPIIYAIPSAVSFYCFIVKRGIGNDKAK